jgi:hypothetical protein
VFSPVFAGIFPAQPKTQENMSLTVWQAGFGRAQPNKTQQDTSGGRVLKTLLPPRVLALVVAYNARIDASIHSRRQRRRGVEASASDDPMSPQHVAPSAPDAAANAKLLLPTNMVISAAPC